MQAIKLFILLSIINVCFSPAFAQTANIDLMENYFNQIKLNPLQLEIFIQNLPKGGILHDHLSGAAYAEDMISDGIHDGYCIDPQNFSLTLNPHCPESFKLSNIAKGGLSYNRSYNHIINQWSMRQFIPNNETAYNHFFDSFYYFLPIIENHRGLVLSELAKRAVYEHVIYLELMVSPKIIQAINLGKKIPSTKNFLNMYAKLQQLGIKQLSEDAAKEINNNEKTMYNNLDCQTKHSAACKITIRYQYQIVRNLPITQVFAQLLLGFDLVNNDPKFVGINLVGPESDPATLRNYTEQMKMIAFLHRLYPQVKIDLHAGELVPTLVPPEDLQNHISQAVNIAHADRIGHGVDIAYEKNPIRLLKEMSQKGILVEICLTSNFDTLSIKPSQHPLPLYLKYNVPVALSTDDPGILRTDINQEFEEAITDFNLSYSEVKDMIRNSLSYSFLPGNNLWGDKSKYIVVPACQNDQLGSYSPSRGCANFIKHSEKAKLQWQLEAQLNQFENNIIEQRKSG